MTTERPIEELIGWRKSGEYDGWLPYGDDEWRQRAEVDDLAAWLREHVGLIFIADDIEWLTDEDEPTCDVLVFEASNESDPSRFIERGPTIREALIAAVRKVADQ